jgi:acyl-CoA thioester hydrolase
MSLNLSSQKIIKDWIDYNGHMNVAYYLLIFDRYGADKLNTIFKMGEESAKNTGMSTMIVENNIAYKRELKVDEEVDINLIYFNHDKKRLHYKFEMINKKDNSLSATFEALALYVNLKDRKVSEFEGEKISIMQNFIKENQHNFNDEDLKYSSKLKI